MARDRYDRRYDRLWNERQMHAKHIVPEKPRAKAVGRSVYFRIANMMRVTDIMEVLGPRLMIGESTTIARTKLLDEASRKKRKYNPYKRISLVYEKEKVIGYTKFDLLEGDSAIGEDRTLVRIEADRIVSADTDLFGFLWKANIIDQTQHLVNRGTDYLGSININDFAKLPFRLCLLSLFLDLEMGIVQQAGGDPERALDLIPEFVGAAKSIYKRQYGERLEPHNSLAVFECVSFSGKCTFLKRILGTDVFDELLDLAVNIRNISAHSSPDDNFLQILNHRALWEITTKMAALNHELRKYVWDGITKLPR